MAFFKIRSAAPEDANPAAQAQSLETIRQRAKYRLLGAALLVILGVLGFSMLLDHQPRPIAVDTPIYIPDRAKIAPLAMPAAPAALPVSAPSAPAASATPAPATPLAAPSAASAVVSATLSSAKPLAPAPRKKDEIISEIAPNAEALRIQSLLEDKPAEKISSAQASAPNQSGSQGKFIVQVGAYSDTTRAREVRLKLEHAGIKTYTQIAQSKDGKRIRVRAGPFADRFDAEKVATKIKQLNLSAVLLRL